MFTGIVTDLGQVKAIERRGDTRIELTTGYDIGTIVIGALISCSGACLTAIDKDPGWFAVSVSAETLARTTLKDWRVGTAVNLERPLKVGDELGGHLVLGHVDGVARVLAVRREGESRRLRIEAPSGLERFIAAKGSVVLDGV